MSADLHLHTTESDGTWQPPELIKEALRHSLQAIAITDHDTTGAISKVKGQAPAHLQVIAGVELSTASPAGQEAHILGYWIDINSPPLQQQLAALRQSRLERAQIILKKLARLGITIPYDEVRLFAQREVVSRSHIAAVLQAREIVQTKDEAFAKFLGQGAPAYAEREKPTPEKAIQTIIKAGGVPVLAHPGLLRDLSIIPSLVTAGLVGLEVVHPSHNASQTEAFKKLAQKWHLLPTGGSDCHGPGGKDEVFLGRYSIPLSWVVELAQRRL